MSVRVLNGDCLRVMRLMRARGVQVDSIVTDPPYHLQSIVKRFGNPDSAPAKDRDGLFKRASRGFMGQQWDGGDVAMNPKTWTLAHDVLKPGGHMLVFGGTRTFHRVAVAIEDAGFEIRDTCMWLYGSGFPKSHNVAKKGAGEAWEGWGTALKPAWEPIIVARKPLSEKSVAANVLAHGTGALNIDGCRVEGGNRPLREVAPMRDDVEYGGNALAGRADGSLQSSRATGETTQGRWPANVIHDGSGEVEAAFPGAPGQQQDVDPNASSPKTTNVYGKMSREGEASAKRRYTENGGTNFALLPGQRRGDTGSAARFFYSAKADADDRLGSKHPTVKPVDLMAYLARLVTPPRGLVLDPFAGSGTTGMACMREGFRCVLIEREADYIADIRRRLQHVSGEDAPLFAEAT